VVCTAGCYVTLAAYDGLALSHLRKKLNFVFVACCALTTYALSHTIGASAFTGAVIRYRAYTAKGLNAAEVGVLVTFCSLTFSLGVMLLVGVAFLLSPTLQDRYADLLPPELVRWLAIGILLVVGLYVLGSALRLPDLRIRGFTVSYPRLPIALKQIAVAPVELVFAGGILYFALPEAGNPGYVVVLGVFAVSFALALLSHAPGGLGVFELAVLMGLPDFEPEAVLAALVVFRIFYFLIPLVIGLGLVALFEHGQLRGRPEPAE
jgi:uncharacterized membrane protein YbhN (UPF0104 family)